MIRYHSYFTNLPLQRGGHAHVPHEALSSFCTLRLCLQTPYAPCELFAICFGTFYAHTPCFGNANICNRVIGNHKTNGNGRIITFTRHWFMPSRRGKYVQVSPAPFLPGFFFFCCQQMSQLQSSWGAQWIAIKLGEFPSVLQTNKTRPWRGIKQAFGNSWTVNSVSMVS